MKPTIILSLTAFLFYSFSFNGPNIEDNQPKRKLIRVRDSHELKNVLSNARPGDSILLSDGVYNGKFFISNKNNGTEKLPITLIGSRKAILDAGTTETGYVLHLQGSYWRLKGFTIQNGLKGLVTDEAGFNTIDGLLITQIGEEAIHLRKFSRHNILQNSEITNTGLKNPEYGEGIYIGSAINHWPKISNGLPDRCDSNTVLQNKIGPFVSAECIDIKEGTSGGIIRGNTFNSQGISGANSADSWIDVKGNYYLVENNKGVNAQPSALKDGYQVNCAVSGWGSYNQFKNNNCDVNAEGYGFNVRLKSSKGEAKANIIYSNNVVKNASAGISNIPTQPIK